jgi:hypothetical protein
LTTGVTGTLATTNGGTGLTSFTTGGVVYASSTSALATGSALVFDGTNLGVGTNGPQAHLDVSGSGNQYLRASSSTNTAFRGFEFGVAGSGTSYGGLAMELNGGELRLSAGFSGWGGFQTFYNNGSEQMRLTSAGNLGLGVTPSAWGQSGTVQAIQIKNTSLAGSGNNAYWGANWYGGGFDKYIANGFASIYIQTAGQHIWNTAPSGTAGNAITFTQAMSLLATGELLVGTTSYAGVGISIATADNNGCYSNSASTATRNHWRFANPNGVVGSIQTSASVTLYNTTSDYRLKTVIGPVANAGQRIDALQPVEYTWNSNGTRTRGFLAHQFQEVYAGSVTGNKDAVDAEGKPVYQAMQASTPEVIADLVAEIQSLRKRLAAAGI